MVKRTGRVGGSSSREGFRARQLPKEVAAVGQGSRAGTGPGYPQGIGDAEGIQSWGSQVCREGEETAFPPLPQHFPHPTAPTP